MATKKKKKAKPAGSAKKSSKTTAKKGRPKRKPSSAAGSKPKPSRSSAKPKPKPSAKPKPKPSAKSKPKPSAKSKPAAKRSKAASAPAASRASSRSSSAANPGKWLVGAGLLGTVALAVVVYAQQDERVEQIETVPIDDTPSTPPPLTATTIPEALRVEVIQRHPHDPEAFTQGLLWHDGHLFESTGLERRSSVRRIELTSGEVAQRRHIMDDEVFAEGLAFADDKLIQLTWQNHKAFVYDAESFELEREFEYEGEGWGVCYDGTHLIMSDGSATLTFRDPETFEVERSVEVTKIGRPLRHLNELECVDGMVYANVWQTDEIVRIDPISGRVGAIIDARGLLTREERRGTDVLNGIAWAADREAFLVTGKLWPWVFEVRFVPR